MLLIHNVINYRATWTYEQNESYLEKCRDYIKFLTAKGKLISAQPFVTDGKTISHINGAWKEMAFNETKDIIVGYYHIVAIDMNDAISMAQGNPEFEYGNTARIEIRPIKVHEESIHFVYPRQAG
jgi:hypothetical protein